MSPVMKISIPETSTQIEQTGSNNLISPTRRYCCTKIATAPFILLRVIYGQEQYDLSAY